MKLTSRVVYGLTLTTTLLLLYFYYQIKTVSNFATRNVETNVLITQAANTVRNEAANKIKKLNIQTTNKVVATKKEVVTKAAKKKEIHSIGEEASGVKASVRGNLGLPRVVIDKKSTDWLKHRWQAAKNMQGEPIPGKHYIEITFKEPVDFIKDITLDYETAFSSKFVITACTSSGCVGQKNILTLFSYKQINNICKTMPVDKSRRQHVVYTLQCNEQQFLHEEKNIEGNINFFKVEMEHSTNWGVSLWHIGINGRYK